MTTIAADLSSMAADSMASDGFADFPVTKIKAVSGRLFGGCGSIVGITKFFAWLEQGRPRKRPKHGGYEEFSVLELNADGLYLWDNCYTPYRVERSFHAIGAGGQAAVALMMKAGMSPGSAVDASCDVAPSACSRPVHVLRLADAQPKQRSRKR